MILIVLAALVLGTFVPLMKLAAEGSRPAVVFGALEALGFVAGTMFTGFFALLLAAMKCDESCDENLVLEARSGEWWHTLDAWQWEVQLLLAVAAFLAAALAFVLVLAKHYGPAVVTVVVGLVLFCGWALLVAPLGDAFGI